MELGQSDISASEWYGLMTSVIVPRPIAWVTTTDGAGHANLAPFSYFSGLGSNPPLMTLGIGNKRGGVLKDTLRIAQQTGVFCVNLVEQPDAERMNASAGDYATDISELAALDIETAPCSAIDGVRVASARAGFECRLVDVHVYGNDKQSNLVVGEIVHAWVADDVSEPGKKRARPDGVDPVARMGAANYARLGERFTLSRPKV